MEALSKAETTTTPTLARVSSPAFELTVAQVTKSSKTSKTATAETNLFGVGDIATTSVRSETGPTQTPVAIAAQQDERLVASSTGGACMESQCSASSAPSLSSSPILSPSYKFIGRNANGTMIATSRPGNDAEAQLYHVLQRASLLSYYDTLLEMGGDDVQQLYEAGEDEFLEIMALVGMASKPLHVRRLQKSLHDWANNPAVFQYSSIGSYPTATFSETLKHPVANIYTEQSPTTYRNTRYPLLTAPPTTSSAFSPLKISGSLPSTSTHHSLNIVPAMIPIQSSAAPAATATMFSTAVLPRTFPEAPLEVTKKHQSQLSHQVTSSSPLLPPLLSESQIARIKQGAEKLARQLPQREPRIHPSKKRTGRELEQVIAMTENDPRRLDEIRKYSAIYGRFDCKRRPEKPLTLHELCVNEAAAQLCRLVPALLTRRDELFPLARQVVKNVGFGHSAAIEKCVVTLPQQGTDEVSLRSSVAIDSCNTAVLATSSSLYSAKRRRSPSLSMLTKPDLSRVSKTDQ